ncbi:MAG: hypothetical protein RSH26_06960 [Clostridia bacterium]
MREAIVALPAQANNMRVRLEANGECERAQTADRLRTPREIRVEGDIQGGTMFDGSRNARIYAAVETMTNEELEAMLQ